MGELCYTIRCMRKVTLCFLQRDEDVCLAMKKRGFGKGKWNGVGGKVEKEERVRHAAVRELQEEIGVRVSEKDLEEIAGLQFYFNGNPDWDQYCHVFLVRSWQGSPAESEEMAPRWYHKNALPFENMWVDDPLWLPYALNNEKIQATFYFNADGSVLEKADVKKESPNHSYV